MKTISTPCSREAHTHCAGCYCDCHPINFDEVVDEIFEALMLEAPDADWYEYAERIKEAHRKSFRHDVESSER